jgi:sucrose-phosphate synthase
MTSFALSAFNAGGENIFAKSCFWPHLEEYVDKTIKFIKRNRAMPDIVHGHYPDAGYVAIQLAEIFGLPFVYTGHSLGRAKFA